MKNRCGRLFVAAVALLCASFLNSFLFIYASANESAEAEAKEKREAAKALDEIARQSIGQREKEFGRNSPEVAEANRAVGLLGVMDGRNFQACAKYFKRLFDMQRASGAMGTEAGQETLMMLAVVEAQEKNYRSAEKYLRQLIKYDCRMSPEESHAPMYNMLLYTTLYEQKKYEEAEIVASGLASTLQKDPAKTETDAAEWIFRAGLCCAKQLKMDEADALFSRGKSMVNSWDADNMVGRAKSVRELVDILKSANRLEDAAALQARLDAASKPLP